MPFQTVECRTSASRQSNNAAVAGLHPERDSRTHLISLNLAPKARKHEKRTGRLERRRSTGPDRAPVHRDRGHPLCIEQHRVTARRRELILWNQLANPYEQQLSIFRSDILHPAEPHSSVTAGVIDEDDLVGRERHPEAVREEHERARRTVTDDPKRRDPVVLPEDRRRRREVDEQRRCRPLGASFYLRMLSSAVWTIDE